MSPVRLRQWQAETTIELNNKYIVLDLSGMPDDMIADGTFWATSIAYDLIMNCEDELSALLADELWSLVGATANPQAAGFVLEMVKTPWPWRDCSYQHPGNAGPFQSGGRELRQRNPRFQPH